MPVIRRVLCTPYEVPSEVLSSVPMIASRRNDLAQLPKCLDRHEPEVLSVGTITTPLHFSILVHPRFFSRLRATPWADAFCSPGLVR